MLISLFFTLLSSLLFRDVPAVPLDRWLVELKSSDSTCLNEWWDNSGFDSNSTFKRPLPVGNWWVVQVPKNQSSSLASLFCVARISVDHKLEWRDTQPNDPGYINQRDMNLISMSKAWDIATGGVTTTGDTIVVAVLDDGYQIDHPDLVRNIWINRLEIADDGVDNDFNGYIDDRTGYNVNNDNDHHPIHSHGTSVAGVIGAVGNNSIGVSGVNWNVKLMLLSGADHESSVIESYQYVLDMKLAYEQSNGTKGAFVVATNLSAGINRAFAADHPLWCEMYDKLGQKGILNVCTAPNESISVDVDGDMPTTCTSPYIIAVTNVDQSDVLVESSGYGPVSIDMGSPGDGTLTTATTSKYKEFAGTSAAAPHVAGLIGLMYSTPCTDFLFDIKSNPSGTATRIKDIILSTGKPNNSLLDMTVTGKRLQADAAMQATVADCGMNAKPGLQIFSIRPNPARLGYIQVYFEVPENAPMTYCDIFTTTGTRLTRVAIEDSDIDQGFIRINTSPLAAGVYLLTLQNDKDSVTRKLVVVI
jgi:subtilisin family serine protease